MLLVGSKGGLQALRQHTADLFVVPVGDSSDLLLIDQVGSKVIEPDGNGVPVALVGHQLPVTVVRHDTGMPLSHHMMG